MDSEAVPVSRPGSEEPPQELRRDLFETYKIERERSRSAQLETLRALWTRVLVRPGAPSSKTSFSNCCGGWTWSPGWRACSGLKADRDTVVVLSEGGANVIVAGVLDRSEAARIGDWVSAAAGVPKERIQIADDLTP